MRGVVRYNNRLTVQVKANNKPANRELMRLFVSGVCSGKIRIAAALTHWLNRKAGQRYAVL